MKCNFLSSTPLVFLYHPGRPYLFLIGGVDRDLQHYVPPSGLLPPSHVLQPRRTPDGRLVLRATLELLTGVRGHVGGLRARTVQQAGGGVVHLGKDENQEFYSESTLSLQILFW